MPRPRRKAFYGTGDDIHLSRIVPTKRQSACPAVVSEDPRRRLAILDKHGRLDARAIPLDSWLDYLL